MNSITKQSNYIITVEIDTISKKKYSTIKSTLYVLQLSWAFSVKVKNWLEKKYELSHLNKAYGANAVQSTPIKRLKNAILIKKKKAKQKKTTELSFVSYTCRWVDLIQHT